jgi:hypothetical protein
MQDSLQQRQIFEVVPEEQKGLIERDAGAFAEREHIVNVCRLSSEDSPYETAGKTCADTPGDLLTRLEVAGRSLQSTAQPLFGCQ